ncbi:hypothetical protein CLAIMM_03735 [Cladophialophora immunda]|nr:hypothetical protein CLAIMM_03735 [Cladophialophora immunda]
MQRTCSIVTIRQVKVNESCGFPGESAAISRHETKQGKDERRGAVRKGGGALRGRLCQIMGGFWWVRRDFIAVSGPWASFGNKHYMDKLYLVNEEGIPQDERHQRHC